MPNTIFTDAVEIIAGLISGQRIAESGRFQIVWIKDHFEIRKTHNPDKESFLIITLQAQDINEGLTNEKWDRISARLRTLISVEVIK